MHGIRLYTRFIIVYLKTKIEYDHFFVVMDFVLNTISPIMNVALLWLMLHRFNNIAGWSFDQLLFLYSLSHLAYMICAMFIWNPTRELQELVRTGGFDSYLTRPIHPITYLIMRQFSHGHFFGLFISFCMLFYSVRQLDLPVTVWSVLSLISLVIGGALIYGAFMLACGSLSFWFIKTESIYNLVVYDLRSITQYPLSLYSKAIKAILLFVVPYGFVNYIPAKGVLFPEKTVWPAELQLLMTPLLGVVLFSAALLFFKFGMRRYQSTGS
ncbi:ABC transporter permease [Cohnella abietis]|uniref:ABC transporter permease n=1 Tax=Cohnella abietis TaxID=2507935 RepID=A0A3T1D0R1_9BACL|nr:ABC-2 family transporter protein [Cohnella abietis]BBI31690.1 ABC transporter permease [Cohnella abietis]